METSDPKQRPALVRGFGLLQSTALNMSNMVGVGPFITIPLILATMQGPQCMLGWIIGAVLALCDGLVWSELAAAMPGAGGTYLYFRETFKNTSFGRLLPFLFIWQFLFSGPLEIASGYIGFSQYVGYFWKSMGPWSARFVALTVGVVVIALLYRRINAIGKLTVVLWYGMLLTVGIVIVSGALHFNAKLAFDFPKNAFSFTRGFALGLGQAMLIAMYDYLGYYDICYVGGEVRNPAHVIPRSIMYSVVAVAAIYMIMNVCILAVVPWREAMKSSFIGAEFMERLYGPWAARGLSLMILWTAFASVFALLLGYSRIPYAAALDGYFFKAFGRLHSTGQFPHVSLLVIGGISILASLIDLSAVLSALLTARILVQFLGQIAAVHYLRHHRPDIERPFRIWLYPLPSLIAFAGWTYIFVTSGTTYILYGFLTIVSGTVVYWIWRRRTA